MSHDTTLSCTSFDVKVTRVKSQIAIILGN